MLSAHSEAIASKTGVSTCYESDACLLLAAPLVRSLTAGVEPAAKIGISVCSEARKQPDFLVTVVGDESEGEGIRIVEEHTASFPRPQVQGTAPDSNSSLPVLPNFNAIDDLV